MPRNSVLFVAVILLVILFIVGGFSVPGISETVQDVAYNIARALVFIYAGWAFCRKLPCAFRTVVFLAIGLSFVDHVILKGGLFLVDGVVDQSTEFADSLNAFFGVLISYAFYAPIAILMVYLGAKTARFTSANR